MRATTLWTALLLSTVLLASQASAEKTTYSTQSGQPSIGQSSSSLGQLASGNWRLERPEAQSPPQNYDPYAGQDAMPSYAEQFAGYAPPYGGSPYGVMPAGYDASPAGYAPGEMYYDPNVVAVGYGHGCDCGNGSCSTCGPQGHFGHGGLGMGHGGCQACGGVGCQSCRGGAFGRLGAGGIGCQACGGVGCDLCGGGAGGCCGLLGGGNYCGFSRGIGNAWDMTDYGGRCAPRYWDVAVDATYFVLEQGSNSTNLTSAGAANNFVLNTNDVDYDHEGGVRISAQRTFLPGSYLEFSYLGMGSYAANTQVTGPGNLFSPFSDFGTDPLGGFAETDNANLNIYTTSNRFDSFELNLRRFWTSPNCWWFGSYWGGFRYVRVEDDATYLTSGVAGSSGLIYDIAAVNDMAGLQIGGDMGVKLTTRLNLTGFAEVGVYSTRANQDSLLRFAGTSLEETFSEERASMVAEGGVLGTFRLTPRTALRFGYQMVIIDGIALAGDSFNFDTPAAGGIGTAFNGRTPRIDDNGHAFYHGATAGFDYSY